jgi:tetratricopeptide (TPR) repeat protein
MMRHGSLSIALITALLAAGASGSVFAQQQTQPVPDAPQPQQKKTAPDKPNADQTSPPASQPASTKDENPFPEATSQDAAKAAQPATPKKSTADENPFPDAVSKDAAKAAQTDGSKQPPQLENPFPESQSRDAAKAAGNDSEPTPAARHDLPPGVSSSSQSGDLSGGAGDDVVDPARAKKDANVGSFYLNSGNYQGALQRYKDATAADPANVDAIFGLAETQRMLKNNAEAVKDYQMYLDILPNGPKSKEALKALKVLAAGK